MKIKNLLALILVLGLSFNAFSQEDISEPIKEEKTKTLKDYRKKGIDSDFGLQVGYGISGWSNKISSIDNLFASPKDQYALRYSNTWSFGFRYKFELNNRWTITTGLGYESNIFRFENNVMLTDIAEDKRIGYETNPAINAKSKIVARYVTLPLFVKFRVANEFNVHVGAIAGVNFRTSSTGFKREYERDAEIKELWGTKYDNFKPLKLDIQAGFGWNVMNFYVKYALTPIFKDNKEIEVYPFTVGISLGI